MSYPEPTLLLSPSGSRDRSGIVAPSVSASIEVVDGHWGPAWWGTASTYEDVTVPASPYLNSDELTVFVRFEWNDESRIMDAGRGTTQLWIDLYIQAGMNDFRTRHRSEDGLLSPLLQIPNTDVPASFGDTITAAIRMSGSGRDLWVAGAHVSGDSFPMPVFPSEWFGVRSPRGTEGIIVYDTALTDEDVQRIMDMDEAWTWWNLTGQEPPYVLPAYRSSLYVLTPRIHHATIDNQIGEDITRHIIDADVDSDIDRSGAKGRCELTSTAPWAVKAGTWVAPFLRVLPEVGEPVEAQLGLYELGEPRITEDEIGPGIATNSGEDIIHRLYRSVPRVAQVTPAGANVMSEVRLAIERATANETGANFAPNGSFDTNIANWAASTSGGATGTAEHNAQSPYGIAPGVARMTVDASSPAGSYRILRFATSYDIPVSTRRLFAFSRALVNGTQARTRMLIRLLNEQGQTVGTASTEWHRHMTANVWHPHTLGTDVPENADRFRVELHVEAVPGSNVVSRWDDVTAHTALGAPITRHVLPDDDRAAPNPISHPAGERWTTRINDQLTALGYHAVYATPEGRPTTRPLRNPRTDEPARVYTIGRDARLVGEVVTDRSASNLYNTVVVVKEDYQTETTMVASASNDDPDHPWSTVNVGVIAATEPVVVSDAVDQAALQDIANERLARASMQETLSIEVLPDPHLGSHDIIEIAGAEGRAKGRWAVESVRWGLTSDDPLVRIGARRTITSGEATTW